MNVNGINRIVEVLWCAIRAEEVRDIIPVAETQGIVECGIAGRALITEKRSQVVSGMKAINPSVQRARAAVPGAVRLLAGHEVIHCASGHVSVLRAAGGEAGKQRADMRAGV